MAYKQARAGDLLSNASLVLGPEHVAVSGNSGVLLGVSFS